MCFHSKQSKDAQTLEHRFKARFISTENFSQGDFNGFTHPFCPIICNEQPECILMAQWGVLPAWAKDRSLQNSTLNARIETISEKPAFKALAAKRCLIPADGYYEWQWLDSKGKNKRKYLLQMPNAELFSFAGLYNVWFDKAAGSTINTFTILTTQANELMSRIHNSQLRMPVVLDFDTEKLWLQNGNLAMGNNRLQAICEEMKQQPGLWDDN